MYTFSHYITVGSSQSHVFSLYTQGGTGLIAERMLVLEEGFLLYGVIPSVILTLPGDLCRIWQLPGLEDPGGRQTASLGWRCTALLYSGETFQFISRQDMPVL